MARNDVSSEHKKDLRNRDVMFGALTFIGLALAVATALALPQLWEDRKVPGLTFVAVAGLLTASTAAGGIAIKGRYSGVFIDERGRYSLSRLQMAFWLVVILAGWSTAIGTNIAAGASEPGDVGISGELIALMGISTGTLFGATAIKWKNAADGRLHFNLAERAEDPLGKELGPNDVDVHVARLSDLIQGESEETKDQVDLSKLQALYFTVVVVAVYSWLVWQVLVPPPSLAPTTSVSALAADASGTAVRKENPVTEMPSINEAFLAIILLSHGGYLALKAVPSSKEEAVKSATEKADAKNAAATPASLAIPAATASTAAGGTTTAPENTLAGPMGGRG